MMLWDPKAGRYYARYFMVLSADLFQADGRDDVQVVQIERPFRPIVVSRLRLKRLGHARSKLPQFEAGLQDLINPGANDPKIDARGYPGSVLVLEVDYTDASGSKNRPVIVVSRPLLWSAHDMVFFMDVSTGLCTDADCRFQYPDRVGLELSMAISKSAVVAN